MSTFRYRCKACDAHLLVKVPFKGRLVWSIDEDDPEFGSAFPALKGKYGNARLACSADPLHETGFHLIDGSVERNLASKAWD
ncbi:MAG: hypothetical protein OXN89_06295 [Bryobacterales bacterium]|nr:hypothetical protein [Bryobacterales bacterium]